MYRVTIHRAPQGHIQATTTRTETYPWRWLARLRAALISSTPDMAHEFDYVWCDLTPLR